MKTKTLNKTTTGFSSNTYQTPAATAGYVVEWWYDKRSRNWIIQYKDSEDNQIGASDYVGTRGDAITAAEIMAKKTAQEML